MGAPWEPDDPVEMESLGVNHYLTSTIWNDVERSEGQYDFSKVDSTTFDNHPHIIRFQTGHGWGTRCSHPPARFASCAPKDLGAWSEKYGYSRLLYNFVSKTLNHVHCGGRSVDYIVVVNEINSPVFWAGTVADYLKTRATVYKAVHDLNEQLGVDVKVTDNGLASEVWGAAVARDKWCAGDRAGALEYFNRFSARRSAPVTEERALALYGSEDTCNNSNALAEHEGREDIVARMMFEIDPALGKPSFDFATYHFYEPWDTQQEVIEWMRREMQKNGYDRPILNTEGGFVDTLRPVDSDDAELVRGLREDYAGDIPKLHAVAFANDVRMWLTMPFTERLEGPNGAVGFNGLVSPDDVSDKSGAAVRRRGPTTRDPTCTWSHDGRPD